MIDSSRKTGSPRSPTPIVGVIRCQIAPSKGPCHFARDTAQPRRYGTHGLCECGGVVKLVVKWTLASYCFEGKASGGPGPAGRTMPRKVSLVSAYQPGVELAEPPPQPEPHVESAATDSQLSEIQAQALHELFNSFDTSHVGYLTRSCLHDGLAHLGQTDDEIDSVWRALHADGTGIVSLDQFVQGLGPSLAKFYSSLTVSEHDDEHAHTSPADTNDVDDEVHSNGTSTPCLSPVAPSATEFSPSGEDSADPVFIAPVRPVRKRSSIQSHALALSRTSSQVATDDAEKRDLKRQLERATAANSAHLEHIAELQRRLDEVAAERSHALSETVCCMYVVCHGASSVPN